MAKAAPATPPMNGDALKPYSAQFWRDESGQDLVEYSLLLLLLAVAGVAAIDTLAATVSTVYSNTNAQLAGS